MAKSLDEQLVENDEKRKELEAERVKLNKENRPHYPKHVRVACGENDPAALRDADGKPYIVVEVKSEAEEKAASSKKSGASALLPDAVTATDTKADAKLAQGRKK